MVNKACKFNLILYGQCIILWCIYIPTRYTVFFYGRVYSQYLSALQRFGPHRSILRSVFQSCMSGLVCGNTRTARCFRPLRCCRKNAVCGQVYSQYLSPLQCFGPHRSILRSVFQSCLSGLVCGNTRTARCFRPLRCCRKNCVLPRSSRKQLTVRESPFTKPAQTAWTLLMMDQWGPKHCRAHWFVNKLGYTRVLCICRTAHTTVSISHFDLRNVHIQAMNG
jgi:hypothetical protein